MEKIFAAAIQFSQLQSRVVGALTHEIQNVGCSIGLEDERDVFFEEDSFCRITSIFIPIFIPIYGF